MTDDAANLIPASYIGFVIIALFDSTLIEAGNCADLISVGKPITLRR